MRKILVNEELPFLIKAKIMIEGPTQFRILAIEKKDGTKVLNKKPIRFRGTEETFAKFLMKLKVKDAESEPATSRNKKYKDMIETAKDGTDPFIWVWSNVWLIGNKIIIKEEQIFFTETKINELMEYLDNQILSQVGIFDTIEVSDHKYNTNEIDDYPIDEHTLYIQFELRIFDDYFRLSGDRVIIQFRLYLEGSGLYTDIELLNPETYYKEFNMIQVYNEHEIVGKLEILLGRGVS